MKTRNRGNKELATISENANVLNHKSQIKNDGNNAPNLEMLKLEYAEANSNIRHYSSLRFAIFTVYFAVIGGLIAVSFGFFENKSGDPAYIKLWGRIGGLIATWLFLVLELNCEQHISTFDKVAINIEQTLDCKQITTKKNLGYSNLFLRPKYAARAIYLALMLFWVLMIINAVLNIARA